MYSWIPVASENNVSIFKYKRLSPNLFFLIKIINSVDYHINLILSLK